MIVWTSVTLEEIKCVTEGLQLDVLDYKLKDRLKVLWKERIFLKPKVEPFSFLEIDYVCEAGVCVRIQLL